MRRKSLFPGAALALLISLITHTASAQSVFMKIGGGYAGSTDAPRGVAVPKIALGYEYEFSQNVAFAPSLGFVGRGWQLADCDTPDLMYDEDGNCLGHRPVTDAEGKPILGIDGKPVDYVYSTMHRTYTANYVQLDLPFNYYHRVGERRYLTLTAGPWAACGVAGKRKTEGDGRAAGTDKVRYTDKTFGLDGAKRFDCGLKVGVGYQFPSSLTINLEGEMGLLPSHSATPDFGEKAGRNMAVMLTLTYKLNKSRWKEEE